MISYEGVIRKRLRLKGHPEIPPYKPPVQNDDPGSVHVADNPEEHPSSEHTQQDHQQHEDDDEITPVTNSQHDQSPSSSTPVPTATDSADRTDTRTDAERRHDQIVLLREEQRLRKEASKSYREKVDVRLVSFYRFYYYYHSDFRIIIPNSFCGVVTPPV